MSILLVGGDKLGNITERLMENGFDDIEHVDGRKSGARKIKISPKTDLVLVLIDYVGHKVAQNMKEESRKNDVRIAFSKRSWIHMEKTVQECVKEIKEGKK